MRVQSTSCSRSFSSLTVIADESSGDAFRLAIGIGFGCRLRPIVSSRLCRLEAPLVLVAGRHRRRRPAHPLMMLDIEKPQPALLAEREPDHAAEFDQFRLGELAV